MIVYCLVKNSTKFFAIVSTVIFLLANNYFASKVFAGEESSAASELHMASGVQQMNLIEMYTSQGCSSCVSADLWATTLVANPKLWSRIALVAFHVDYWNYLGWHDRFSSKKFSTRQRHHYQQRQISSVYTPGVLKNGREWQAWRVYQGSSLSLDNSKNIGILDVRINAQQEVVVNFAPVITIPQHIDLHVALLGFGFRESISNGENNGLTLAQDFVVLGYTVTTSKQLQWHTHIPKARQKGAKRYALTLWISSHNRLEPIQAVGSWLPNNFRPN